MSLRTARRLVSGSIVLGLLAGGIVLAQEARIAVIIDDVGHRLDAGRRTLTLPAPVAVAILPHAPHARTLAEEAAALGHDVLVHMPMQPSSRSADPGPGALTLAHDRSAVRAALTAALAAVPHAIGVNNHMGSLLTRDVQAMDAFMAELALRPGLIFVDSYTTHLSVGLMKAREHGIAALKRDVFVDADLRADSLESEWRRLLDIARKRGFAVAIAHPHPDVLAMLEREIALLDDVELVAVPALLEQADAQRSYAELIGQVPTGDFITSQRVH